jgi:hypothetical protein
MMIASLPRERNRSTFTNARWSVALATGALGAAATAAHAQVAATAHVNATSVVAAVSDIGLGLHTSVYANQFGNPNLPGRLRDSGVQLLRYPGGSYSDVYQWSTHSSNQPSYIASASHFANFVHLMDATGAKGMVTVDYGDSFRGTMGGQPQEAAAWVAYANADAGLYGAANDVALGADLEANNWYTAGYWSKLRASTVQQYRQWSQAAGTYNAAYEFLATGRAAPVGIKYWEIGNEIGGNGYTGIQWEFDHHAPYVNGTNDNTGRKGNPLLSPTAYATNLLGFATWMKKVDPTIKIGAGLDESSTSSNRDILTTAGGSIDFGIVHWYPSGTNDQVLNAVPQRLPAVAQAIRSDFANYAHKGPNDYELHLTEFGYGFGNPPHPSYNALFVADAYATGQEQGIRSMQYLEMSGGSFLGDSSSLTPGEADYAMQMVDRLSNPGDQFVSVTSSLSTLHIHAVKRADGGLALMFINEAAGDGIADALVSLDVTGLNLATTGQYYEYGWDNVDAGVGPYQWTLTGLTGTFQVRVPDVSIVTLLMNPVPEPASACVLMADGMLMLSRRHRKSR